MSIYRESIIDCVLRGQDSLHLYPRKYQKKQLLAELTVHRRSHNLGPTVIITPMTSVVMDNQQMMEHYKLKAFLVSGSNHHLFQGVLKQLSQNSVDVLFMTIEQLSNPPKFEQVLSALPSNSLIVVDHAHMASIYHPQFQVDYHRIEAYRKQVDATWLFLSHFTSQEDTQYLEQLWSLKANQSEEEMVEKKEVYVVDDHQIQIDQVIALVSMGSPTQMIITPTFSSADKWTALLLQLGYSVGCYHRKVEESTKVMMMERFYQGKLDVLVTTADSEIGYDHPSISSILFTFVPLSSTLAKVYTSRLIPEGAVQFVLRKDEDLFDSMYSLLTPLDHRLDQLVTLISTKEEGMMLRDCEHTLNIPSYTMEKMFKVLKAYDVIERNNMAYRCVKPSFRHDAKVEHHRKERMNQRYLEFTSSLLKNSQIIETHELASSDIETISQSHEVVRVKKMFPRTTYPSSIIQPHHQHEEGICMMYPFKNDVQAIDAIASVLFRAFNGDFSSVVLVSSPDSKKLSLIKQLSDRLGIEYRQPFKTSLLDRNEGDYANPYMQVRYALNQSEGVQNVFEQPVRLILWMDALYDGWATAVYSERLLQFDHVLSVFPLGYSRD